MPLSSYTARMRESLPSNGTTTVTRSEFSDDNFDEEEVHDEESAPDDGKIIFLHSLVNLSTLCTSCYPRWISTRACNPQ